jgi:hypothetical protein
MFSLVINPDRDLVSNGLPIKGEKKKIQVMKN